MDAVVVATGSYDSSHVPPIPNLDGWASAFPKQVYHSREYRHPEDLKGKVYFLLSDIYRGVKVSDNIILECPNCRSEYQRV